MTRKRWGTSSWAKSLGVVAMAVVALSACRAEEQDRIVRFEPGVYKGKPDQKLEEGTFQTLRGRALKQGGSSGSGFPVSGGIAQSSNVRPPVDSSTRALLQGGSK